MSIIDIINEWADHYEVGLLLVGTKEEQEKYAPAIVGISDGHWDDDRMAVIYDEDKMIEIIAKDMESEDEEEDPYALAVEYFDFNIKGAWLGEFTPIFIKTFRDEEKLLE